MNFNEIRSAVRHLVKTSSCIHCKKNYKYSDINIIASTQFEGLFEMKCLDCKASTIVSVFLAPDKEKDFPSTMRTHQGISQNEVLDMRNFLSNFDGNFKKIFLNEKQ